MEQRIVAVLQVASPQLNVARYEGIEIPDDGANVRWNPGIFYFFSNVTIRRVILR
jgi:hypothetical protein